MFTICGSGRGPSARRAESRIRVSYVQAQQSLTSDILSHLSAHAVALIFRGVEDKNAGQGVRRGKRRSSTS